MQVEKWKIFEPWTILILRYASNSALTKFKCIQYFVIYV